MEIYFFAYLLIGTITFNLILIFGAMLLVRKVKKDQRVRQQKLVEQAKITYTLEETIVWKNKIIENYNQMYKRL